MRPDDSRASGRPHGGWIAVSFVAGLLGGAAMLALLPVARSRDTDVPLSVSGLDELDRNVQELTREIQALRTAPALPATGAVPTTVSAVEPLRTSTDADLRALITRLDEVLGQARTLGAAGASPPLLIPDPSATEPARQALLEGEPYTISADDFLMTYQQTVDRYGRPGAIRFRDDGTVEWVYYGRDDPDRQRMFRFVDGFVSECR